MKYIFNHISYLPATCFGSYNWSHLEAELLRVICTVGMLVNFEISYYNYLNYCGIKYTYLLTPWSRVLLEKLIGLHLVKKFPAFYGT
jgi:hypothetical protein